MAQILVTKPGTLNQRDKAALRKAGVVCVEADDPASVKLIQAQGPELSANDMLYAALCGANKRWEGQAEFTGMMQKLMAAAIDHRSAG